MYCIAENIPPAVSGSIFRTATEKMTLSNSESQRQPFQLTPARIKSLLITAGAGSSWRFSLDPTRLLWRKPISPRCYRLPLCHHRYWSVVSAARSNGSPSRENKASLPGLRPQRSPYFQTRFSNRTRSEPQIDFMLQTAAPDA